MTDSKIKFYNVPVVINITLYKNNYIDNVIIGELKRGAFKIELVGDNNSFSVAAEELKKIIVRKFKSKIDALEDLSKEILSQHINSAYFMDSMLSKFINLKIVNINISNNRQYSRVFKINNEQSVIGFDYKIVQGILDYPEFLDSEQLNRFNILIKRLNLESNNLSLDPYYIIRAQDFMNRISMLENEDKSFFDDNIDIIEITYELLEPKIETDNTMLIIKTDF